MLTFKKINAQEIGNFLIESRGSYKWFAIQYHHASTCDYIYEYWVYCVISYAIVNHTMIHATLHMKKFVYGDIETIVPFARYFVHHLWHAMISVGPHYKFPSVEININIFSIKQKIKRLSEAIHACSWLLQLNKTNF